MIWKQPPRGGYPDASMMGLPGIERMRASREGRVPMPPIAYLTEMPFRELSEGHAGFEMPSSSWFANSAGLIGGGMLAVLADAALGAPIHTELPAGVAFTTAEISMTLLKPVRPDPDGTISGSGHVIHRGRTLALSEAFLYNDATEDLVAHGTSRCTVFPPVDPLPDPPAEMPVLDQPYPGTEPSHPLRRALEGGALDQAVFDRLSGVEVLRGQISGELEPAPPIHHLTGIEITTAEEGAVTMTLPCSPWLSTSMGTVQGGFTAMLAEFALATGSSMYLPGRPADLTGVEQLASESKDPEDEPGA